MPEEYEKAPLAIDEESIPTVNDMDQLLDPDEMFRRLSAQIKELERKGWADTKDIVIK